MSRFEFSFDKIWKEDILPFMKTLPLIVPLRKLMNVFRVIILAEMSLFEAR